MPERSVKGGIVGFSLVLLELAVLPVAVAEVVVLVVALAAAELCGSSGADFDYYSVLRVNTSTLQPTTQPSTLNILRNPPLLRF